MAHRPDGKYEGILKAAIEVISEKGLDKTSISDIVRKAGIAQGTFYLYFQSKNDLIPAIAENLLSITLADIQEKAGGKASFWDVLDVVIDETLRMTETHKHIIVLLYSGLALHHSLDKWEAVYRPYYDWLEERLEEAVRNDEIVAGIHIPWTSKSIINLVENAAERYYIGLEQGEPLETFKSELFRFIQRSLKK